MHTYTRSNMHIQSGITNWIATHTCRITYHRVLTIANQHDLNSLSTRHRSCRRPNRSSQTICNTHTCAWAYIYMYMYIYICSDYHRSARQETWVGYMRTRVYTCMYVSICRIPPFSTFKGGSKLKIHACIHTQTHVNRMLIHMHALQHACIRPKDASA